MITVLRLGHRISRDKRSTTHVALVARAFGADMMLVGARDEDLEKRITGFVEQFGGDFEVETGCNWKEVLNTWQGIIVHLTMYGEQIDDVLSRISRDDDLIVVVGAEKMPPDVFKKAHFNVAVGNQPHSEVSALAVFLDRYFKGEELRKSFEGVLKVVPSPSGKKVVNRLPTGDDCMRILREVGCDDATIEHSMAVNRLAVKLAKLCSADVELVDAASMLHDIGRAKGHNIRHGAEGARMLRELGLPRDVVRIVEKHVGAGLDHKEVLRLGLPKRDYVPRTLEEKLVCHADSLISHNKKIRLEEELKSYEKQGLGKYVETLKRLHKELSEACGVDLDELTLD